MVKEIDVFALVVTCLETAGKKGELSPNSAPSVREVIEGIPKRYYEDMFFYKVFLKNADTLMDLTNRAPGANEYLTKYLQNNDKDAELKVIGFTDKYDIFMESFQGKGSGLTSGTFKQYKLTYLGLAQDIRKRYGEQKLGGRDGKT